MTKGIRVEKSQALKEAIAGYQLYGLIAVLGEQGGPDQELVAMLEDAGYRVEVFDQLEGFKSICDEGKEPAAVILDRTFSRDDNEPARIIAKMQAQCKNSVPVIFLSPRKDMASRLAAHRMGATHYLDRPADFNRLLRMIAESALLTPAQPYRVMLVDDESVQQEQHALILRQAGMEVCIVNDPLRVMEMLDNFAADVLLVGMDMVRCSGPELAAVLHDEQRYRSIPIIYLSTLSELLRQIQSIDRSSSENYLSELVAPEHMIAVISKHAQNYRRALEQEEILRTTRYELERQRQALDAHAIVSAADLSGNIVYANEKFTGISGYGSSELLGKNHRIIKSGQHPPEFYADMWHTITSGNIWHGEVCDRNKNGNLYWMETTIVPFVGADDMPYQYISLRTDITHVKENEQRLNRSLAYANIGTWDWNIKRGLISWSERIPYLFGYSGGGLAQTYENFLNAAHPDDMQMLGDAIRDCVERGLNYNVEHRCVWPDGSIHWLLQRGDVVRELDGTPLHMLGLVQDVTLRKQAELALVESSARLEEAQNLAKLGNWEADIASGKLHWSDEIYNIFGLDKARFTPTIEAFQSSVHPDDQATVLASERRAAKTGFLDVIHRIVRPDGTIRYVHELARGQLDSDGQLLRLRGTVQDVTELKQTELAMLQAKEAAEAASRAKSEFLASMSHELRTPLNAILGFSQLFGMDEQLPQKTRNNALQIEQAGQHLLSLVNDLIDLARIESNRLELFMEAVKVRRVVRESLDMVRSMADAGGIRIRVRQCDAMDICVRADFNRLRQALINLLTNAIKYNKPRGTVQLECGLAAGGVHIAVTDSGAGIPREKQERIFNAFDRLGKERGEVEGTGIGLVITKQIVEAMGGRVGFKSNEKEGSTFWLEIPLATGKEISEAKASAAGSANGSGFYPAYAPASTPVVLYIEDNPMNLRLMQQIFAGRKEWKLLSAVTAESGIELARAQPPQLVLMDINLPGIDGYQALSILKSEPETAAIPVVALTANAMKGDRERGIAAGFSDYLTKPLDILQLLELLGKLLD